ncbi:MAG TPA: undecaprenyldiphospho-muramoylpentapeptide beta-N-acetylglucosaminyltransferase [Nitrolancea sp.]|nr:undecaprenyldiphospho-muramoylpentapeptide beta-N-acetylglucosaminyltransferase [Nitrolancea sp.]
MSKTVRIVIAGGGTGGHVQPAVAVFQFLNQTIDVKALWIGSHHGTEQAAATQTGILFTPIQTGKFRRYLSFQTPLDLMRIPLGVLQALRVLRRFRPDVVLSTGGFVSVPTVVAARMLRIPSITHEQTATIGLATRINARFASVVALTFEQSRTQIRKTNADIVVTGNPIRASLLGGSATAAFQQFNFTPNLPFIYVTGGALGAHAINEAVSAALPRLLRSTQIVHQCGPESANADYSRLLEVGLKLQSELQNRYVVRERIGTELADIYAGASLVVGRAGAGTVAELAALGKPSILIPLPGAGGDEQTLNARVLADAGGSVLLPQSELTPDRLSSEIERLLQSGRLDEMAASARQCGRTDAAERLADETLKLIQ